MKTAADYAALAESELRDAWEEVRHERDTELAEWSFRAAGVYATLAVAAATYGALPTDNFARIRAAQ